MIEYHLFLVKKKLWTNVTLMEWLNWKKLNSAWTFIFYFLWRNERI